MISLVRRISCVHCPLRLRSAPNSGKSNYVERYISGSENRKVVHPSFLVLERYQTKYVLYLNKRFVLKNSL